MPGSWALGGNLALGRSYLGGAGSQDAGLSFGGFIPSIPKANTEEYDGSSWSAGGDLVQAVYGMGSAGTQIAALCIGGYTTTHSLKTQEYNGTTWSYGGDISESLYVLAGCGTQSAGLHFGGYRISRAVITEEYNGTAWSSGGDLSVGTSDLAGCGTQTAGLCFGGYDTSVTDKTEEYNGTAWSAGGDLATARNEIGGCGTSQAAGLSFGGYAAGYSTITEEYNGISWSAGGDLPTATSRMGGAGAKSEGLSFGGKTSAGYVVTTQEYLMPFSFDGKIRIKDTTTKLFDGRAVIDWFGEDPFDGKLRIKNETANLFDGKVYVHVLPGVWSSGGNLLTGRHSLGGCGTQTAGLNFGGEDSGDTTSSVCEEYNGTAWSVGGNLGTGRRNLSGCGTQSAGLNFGGTIAIADKDSEVTEEYNGTTWSSGGDLALARTALAGCGTQSAGLSFGGNDGGTLEVKTEHYNGTAWSNGGDLITAREWLAGAGTQSAGLSFGGYTTSQSVKTEEYNGTAWSAGGDLATARSALAGCGTQSDGLSFGGTTGSNSNKTEHYNGIVWWAGGDLTTARYGLAGCGLNSAGLSFGGYSYLTNTEVYGPGTPANFTYLFDGKLFITLPEAEHFDGKVIVGCFPTNFFDGELRIKDAKFYRFDSKIKIFDRSSNPFDGWIYLLKSSSNLFDGKVKIQYAPINLFDGIIRIKDEFPSLLDGRIRIWDGTISLFDGQIHLFKPASNVFDGKTAVSSPGAEQDFFDGKIQIGNETTDLFDGKVYIHTGIPSIWCMGGDLSVAKDFLAGAGTLYAGLCIAGRYGGDAQKTTEEYNGIAWSASGDLAVAKYESSACGMQAAAINFAGWQLGLGTSKNTEHYNGVSWSAGGDLSSKRKACGAAGVEVAALSIGGWFSGSPGIQTEEYNGTVWSSGGNLITARYALAGAGTQTAGLSFGGSGGPSKTEEYNGTAWSSGGDLGTGRSYLGGCGTQLAGLSFAGVGPLATTEEYNGTLWASANSLNTARHSVGGGGVIDAGLCFGGCCYFKSSEEYGLQSSDIFDGRLYLFGSGTPLLDGRVVVVPPGMQEFDGRIYLLKQESDLFAGKVEIALKRVWLVAADHPNSAAYMGSAGSQTATLSFFGNIGITSFAFAYKYNGTAWLSASNGYARSRLGSCGTQSAALGFGGVGAYVVKETYEFNGSFWSLGGDLSKTKEDLVGAGTQTAGLCFGGDGYVTEEYNGTAWSAGGDLQAYKYFAAGAGLQTAALAFNNTDTEEYNGTAWLVGGDLNVSRYALAGDGAQAAALSFGGYWSGNYKTTTEEYDGTSWAVCNDLNTARKSLGGCGTTSAALSFGGFDGFTIKAAEEYGLIGYGVLDGKVQIKDETIKLFDGKADISNFDTVVFDGRANLAYFGSDLFDGKLRLGFSWRESLLGGFGEPYKLDIDPPLGSSSICSVRFSLVVTETRIILSALGETLKHLLHIPMAETNQQAVSNCLSNYISAIQSSINKLLVGDPSLGKQSIFTSSQSDVGALVLHNELSGVAAGIQSLITALTESVSSQASLINELALKEDIHSLLALLGSMSDPAVFYPDCTLSVYLDGIPIKPKQITSLSFTMDRGVTFDVLSLNSTDVRLYASLQTIVGNEDSVIEVQYQGTSWMFLIEEVSGFELSFSVWGRSIAAAKSDAPFKDSTNFVLETDTLASSVAEDLVPELSVTWNAVDWTILADWSVDGTPVQMLKILADSVGAVVRSYPDGTGFYVDEKYTTRPTDLPYAASVADFDRDVNLISLDASRDLGTGANAVTVHGYSPLNKYSVRLEADSCVDVGNPAIIKVYPALEGVGYSLMASDGVPAYQHSLSEEHVEIVNFVGGKGSVSYPITALTSITWDGVAPAGFEYTAGQDEIVLTDDTPAAVGEVVYSTRYDVWHGAHSGEGQLLVVCYLDEGGGIVVRVYFGDGDREADDIDKPILTSIEAAVAAGQAFLDDTSYNRLLRSISAPCSDVSDGDVVSVSSDLSGVTGNTIVLRHEVSAQVDGEALKISSNLDVVQFEAQT